MATVLAYTSPALGHLLPISALLSELSDRGHRIHLRTLSSGVALAERLGFAAAPIDRRIENIQHDDFTATNPLAALKLSVAVFDKRAVYEVADLAGAIAQSRPDALLVDVNCWGALSAAEAAGVPWACFAPYTPPLRAPGVPPFGFGLKPLPGVLGAVRDGAVRATLLRAIEKVMLPPINGIRADVNVPPVASVDEFLRRAPQMFIATGKPFQYQRTEWGEAVHMIGPCALDPEPDGQPAWLDSIDRPIVLVTTSSEAQADVDLITTAIAALAGEPVHIVATAPAGHAEGIPESPNATVCRFVPHGLVLDRAVCAITHGGMGATQKALARGVPVCVVPYGRDQFEVARRAEVSGCGTRLPAKRLTPKRLQAKVREAMTMTAGAERVAAGFEATGGVARGADLFEQRTLELSSS
ncbi:glycosyl transferase [Mycobacterium sp. ACS1612]|uniref:glycosyltransferase n=1 Tax=Mycobacterium sp. ACS1612 TaxID=1834117 RepID=UPI0007FD14C0|nr:nucleotide disphospho-sugar-binding domain-containing protein [Mycobacterium sp. ACS1612]OBF36289.1 glycosyl transferase [Mycobacterium sp. ACS1612]